MIDRIKDLMEKKNLTSTQFSDEIGIQRSSLSHVLSGRNKPSLDFMLKVKERFPEINLDWLLLGSGKMFVEDKNGPITNSSEIDENIKTENRELDFQRKITDQMLREEDKKLIMARSEEPASYGKNSGTTEKQPEKIIMFYPDQTFLVYHPTNKKG
jgi:transcriptional regulator with XRE-family HTH domain